MIPLMKTTFCHDMETRRRLADFILGADRLSMGELCLEFEQAFARYLGLSQCVLFNSGSSANLALLQSLCNMGRLRPGDKVGFSALTWATNVMPIIQLGLRPVPVDCDPGTLNAMSGDVLKRLEQGGLQALFLTNALGFAGDLGAIRDLCAERGILLLEDNCEALGTRLDGGLTGTFGLGSTFSFFIAHHMSTIEGGMVATADGDLAAMLRMVRANGWDRSLDPDRQKALRAAHEVGGDFEAKYTFYELGFNLRPTELTGFLGLDQLAYLDENIARREALYTRLEAAAAANPDLHAVSRDHLEFLSPFSFPVLCRDVAGKVRYQELFARHEVEIRPIIGGNIQVQPFFRKHVHGTWDCPGAETVHGTGFYFGLYPELDESDLGVLERCLAG